MSQPRAASKVEVKRMNLKNKCKRRSAARRNEASESPPSINVPVNHKFNAVPNTHLKVTQDFTIWLFLVF